MLNVRPPTGSATSTPTPPASRATKPFLATADYLERCRIDPTKFIPWREHAQAADLDDDFNVLVPLYVRAQLKVSERGGFNFGENPVQDMLALGVTKEAAESAAHISLDVYGHRTPVAWAEMVIYDAVWGME
ncbi:hypothetical protein VOLCADRAFT_100217 [Volvox carteri f. nagariensis]|uniref:Uncharacterized protein n=1 Tax=Volvox carteri f. nagariensis TaxID=3068 RepID=D8UJQ6_VOLCA|nr:uncharacterized protein VOLCADRAFT_100217 [Volvox carteri f. nagariensis]EFJ40031.1 hypothetical protein VOLCADRAFT_100217 [Volvox carteri f. nagariensis]|eukprot:XP_002958900.1 hypothetical protein VOLCADRAFT_100217 [Volvox carteri f. nagariensis]